MCLFTVLMTYDIYEFGEKMRKLQDEMRKLQEEHSAQKQEKSCTMPKIFGRAGKFVLLSIGILICAGWLLAGIH